MAAPPRGREPRARQPPQGRAGTQSARRRRRPRRRPHRCPLRPSSGYAFAGELSLKGELLPTPGILSVAIAAARAGLNGVVVPAANALEAAQIGSLRIVAAATLADVARFLQGTWDPPEVDMAAIRARGGVEGRPRRGAGAGAGPSRARGGGRRRTQPAHDRTARRRKTMLARRLATILPPLSREEALEATQLHSVAGLLTDRGVLTTRPFRAPHHSVSIAGLLGGGLDVPAPGRGEPGPSRGPLPGRAHGVPARRRSRVCGSLSRTVVSWSPALRARSSSRLGSHWSPRPTRARAASTAIIASTVAVGRTGWSCISRSCRVRCSTGSTSVCGSLVSRNRSCWGRSAGSGATRCAPGCRKLGNASGIGTRRSASRATPTCRDRSSVAMRTSRHAAEELLASAVEALALTGRGFDRALKVARTVADLAAVSAHRGGSPRRGAFLPRGFGEEGLARAG